MSWETNTTAGSQVNREIRCRRHGRCCAGWISTLAGIMFSDERVETPLQFFDGQSELLAQRGPQEFLKQEPIKLLAQMVVRVIAGSDDDVLNVRSGKERVKRVP